jgi:hypothetical protein
MLIFGVSDIGIGHLEYLQDVDSQLGENNIFDTYTTFCCKCLLPKDTRGLEPFPETNEPTGDVLPVPTACWQPSLPDAIASCWRPPI